VTLQSPAILSLAQGGSSPQLLSILDGLVSQQSAMIAYLDDFWMMMVVTLISLPIVFLLRRPQSGARPDPAHAVAE